MPSESLWLCIAALSSALDGRGKLDDDRVDQIAMAVLQMPNGQREDIRRRMVAVITGLSQVEFRVKEAAGDSGKLARSPERGTGQQAESAELADWR